MEIVNTAVVNASLNDVSTYFEAFVVLPPAPGSLAKQALDRLGVAFVAPDITRVTSQYFTARVEQQGIAVDTDYTFRAVPQGTEVTVRVAFDVDALVDKAIEQAAAQGMSSEQLERVRGFTKSMMEMGLKAGQATAQTALKDWAVQFATYITEQKMLGGGPGNQLGA